MPRIYTIGETVYDIIFKNDQPISAMAGGAMLNTSVSLGRLELPVTFLSEIGKDIVGGIITGFLLENGVDGSYIYRFSEGKTALALAFLDENENAEYSFYKMYPIERMKMEFPKVEPGDIVLFGSFFAITEAVREPLMGFIKNARNAGAIIIYDPNFRKPHLHELPEIKKYIEENIFYADIIRGSDEDFQLIFKTETADQTFHKINQFGKKTLAYTAGSNNVDFVSSEMRFSLPVIPIQPISTVGAGDTFNAGIIYGLYKNAITKEKLKILNQSHWDKIISTSIEFAADVCCSYNNYISEEMANMVKMEGD
jgi:fructokinase